MNTADAITALAAKTGLPGLKLDPENTCSLTIDDDLEVFLRGEPQGTILRLNAVIGDMAEDRPDPLRLLEVNYNISETGHGAISVNRMTGEIIYVQSLDIAALDADALVGRVETFLKYAEFWAGYLPEMGAVPDGPDAPAPEQETMIRV